ncbi:AMP-binding protein [Metabacillus fastidiosus]|uniref:AMP-binding protein n=1 Tax=Metabacillus fastidiosus TaxID=1458 RepID=A0ABU6P209_9BACI|nr:AMP-binding protein [Metabacillus fastidiosus]MED4403401.1 AMP-binding protein [Metabacillus fastidiosus]MED4460755.1 AMP-binding protein [Metabacillus fastidiosus]
MFFVNDDYYTLDDLEKQYAVFESMPHIRDCHNKRLAVCITDVFQWLALCLYIRRKGGSVVPIHPSTPKDGAVRIASSANSHLLLFGSIEFPIELTVKENEKEGVLVQMSSGTTGAPKCIERTWDSVEEEVDSYVTVLPADHTRKSIIACPMTHSYGLISGFFACVKRGAEPVILTNMNPKYILKKLQEYKKYILYAAPALLYTLSRFLPSDQKFDYVMTSGTVMPSSWLALLRDSSNLVLQQYGCSEAGCITLHPDVQNSSEMGYILPHLKVDAGNVDASGEIIVYTSAQTIYTKDIGYIENGVLSFLSRMDDMINVAGLNVYPQEVENILMDEPRITEAVVYKKQNALSGERVCVQYVSSERVDEIELREWCGKYLAPHQIPMEFIQVDEIEKLPNGKVSRKKLGGVLA